MSEPSDIREQLSALEFKFAARLTALEVLMPFAMAGRIPLAAEINNAVPPDDPRKPETIATRRMIDRMIGAAHYLEE